MTRKTFLMVVRFIFSMVLRTKCEMESNIQTINLKTLFLVLFVFILSIDEDSLFWFYDILFVKNCKHDTYV